MDYIKIRFGLNPDESDPEVERSFDDLIRGSHSLFVLSERNWKPQMDIYETPEEFFIIGELAGVTQDELDVEISRKAVKISGTRNHLDIPGQSNYRLAEIQYGKFERTLYLPSPIDTDIVSAVCNNGILTIRLAKFHTEISRSIPISEG